VDGDQFPNLRGEVRRLCGSVAQSGRAFARADGRTDCCDADARAFPGAIPPPGMRSGIAGFADANACGNFDYDCVNGDASGGSQARVDNGSCVSTDLTGVPEAQTESLCASLSGWEIVMPSGRIVQCLAFGGFSTCLVAAVPIETRLCF
jgi:hypothetical protein